MVSMDAIYVKILETLRQASPYIGIGHGSPVLHPERTKASLPMQKMQLFDGVTVSAEVIYSLSSSEQANTGTCLDYLHYIS